MSAPVRNLEAWDTLTTQDVRPIGPTAAYGTTTPVRASCDCPRRVPLEGFRKNLELVRALARLPSNLPLLTHRCRECKRVTVIRVQHLLASS